MAWPLIPAGVLAILGAGVLFSLGSAANYVWALALIAVGLWLLYRQFSRAESFERKH